MGRAALKKPRLPTTRCCNVLYHTQRAAVGALQCEQGATGGGEAERGGGVAAGEKEREGGMPKKGTTSVLQNKREGGLQQGGYLGGPA